MTSQRFRRLTDLFVRGKAVRLPDDTYLWVQAINSYERDECVSDAGVTRARFVMALREDGTERVKVEARMAELGRDAMVDDLVQSKLDGKYVDIVNSVENDPDWAERISILQRHDPSTTATPESEEEAKLIGVLNHDWAEEVKKRVEDERAYQTDHYHHVSDEELLADYVEAWLDRKGGERAAAEYALTELWYATRYCEATVAAGVADDEVDHSRCQGHPSRVFSSKAEARAIPDELRALLGDAIAGLGMSVRDPKGSDSPTNSSDSPPMPSEPEASTPSTSTETPKELLGTSASP